MKIFNEIRNTKYEIRLFNEIRNIGAKFVFLCVLCLCTGCLWAADLYLDVSKATYRKIAVAVPDFRGDNVSGANAAGIITSDLRFSGFFKPVESAFLKEVAPGSLDFSEWRSIGAELIVTGNITAGDEVVLECRMYDAARGSQVLGKVYRGDRKLLRKMVHRFSDEVVRRVTGEKGISRTKIAFVSGGSGHKEIYVMDYDGYNPVRMTFDRSVATVPSWLPSGGRVAYTTYRGGNPDLYVRDIESGSTEKLCTFNGLNYGASWSPSGRWFTVALTRDGNAEIYLLKSNGKGEKRLTRHPKVDCSPSWAPDGKHIVFTSGRAGGPHIYVMNTNGKILRRLTDAGYSDSPEWSSRGDTIVYSSQKASQFNIWTMNPDGSGKKQLTANSGDNENPSFSPDGLHIVFSSTRDGNKNIYVMGTDGSNQKKLTLMEGDNEYPCWSP